MTALGIAARTSRVASSPFVGSHMECDNLPRAHPSLDDATALAARDRPVRQQRDVDTGRVEPEWSERLLAEIRVPDVQHASAAELDDVAEVLDAWVAAVREAEELDLDSADVLAASRAGSERSRQEPFRWQAASGRVPRRLSITCFAASSVARGFARTCAVMGIGWKWSPCRCVTRIRSTESKGRRACWSDVRVESAGTAYPLSYFKKRASIRTFFPPDESITPSFARKVMLTPSCWAGL